jgi:hypothetical protein
MQDFQGAGIPVSRARVEMVRLGSWKECLQRGNMNSSCRQNYLSLRRLSGCSVGLECCVLCLGGDGSWRCVRTAGCRCRMERGDHLRQLWLRV